MPPVIQAFQMISTAQVAKSAQEAQSMLILRPGDGITMNRDRLLADAKAKALALVDGYTAPEPIEIRLPGPTAKVAMAMAVKDFRTMGKATPHDEAVSLALADVLSGGDTDMTETWVKRICWRWSGKLSCVWSKTVTRWPACNTCWKPVNR
ncbi:MAG: hypothetical protein R3E95_15465 [Thiolinea sp.]